MREERLEYCDFLFVFERYKKLRKDKAQIKPGKEQTLVLHLYLY